MAREEAAKMFNLSRLPESAGDTLRIVYIGDPDSPEGALDACPCIGEHVAHTAECGKFVWVSHEWKPDDGGVLRIPFQAGTLAVPAAIMTCICSVQPPAWSFSAEKSESL